MFKNNTPKKNNKIKARILSGILSVCISTSLIISPNINTAYAQTSDNIKIYINNSLLVTNQAPFISEGRTFVPLRVISENLGAKVEWDDVNRKVIITKGSSSITVYIDNRLYSYTVDGKTQYGVSDVAPVIKGDYTYVPLRLIGNALGLNAEWNNEKREVILNQAADVSITDFYSIRINEISNGQIIQSKTNLSLSSMSTLPSNAAQIRYLFLNPKTGTGKIVAMTTNINTPAEFIPDTNMNGTGVLAAVVCDSKGNFLAGTCVEATISVAPTVSISGMSEGQAISSTLALQANLNFRPESITYEFTYSNGSVVPIEDLDPYGTYNFTPSISNNGPFSVKLIAVDSNGAKYESQVINGIISMQAVPVTPYVTLKSFSTANVGKTPVTLSIARNFDVDTTQYYAKNTSTGQVVLLKEVGWGDCSWFPGPNMAGEWEVYVRVINSKTKVAYTSNSIKVTIPSTANLILSGVGPDQVITSKFTMSSYSNVPIKDVSYIISNPYNGTEYNMGTASSTSEKISFTPGHVNEGYRYIQAFATTADGQILKSEKIMVRIYFGETYGSQAITAKDNFINYAATMAMKTQKENGMSAALQIAQAILETGWGQYVPVDKYSGLFSNNLFGVKGTGNAGSVLCTTKEEYYGTVYVIDANFRAYKTAQDSWDDHSDLFFRLDRYIPYRNVMFNSTAGAYALKRCGYATDSGYPGKLIWMIERYDLDKYDQQKI